MSAYGQPRKVRFSTWILAVFGLLVLVAAITAVIHPVFAPLWLILLPVFLFCWIDDCIRWIPIDSSRRVRCNRDPIRAALFQRPPPHIS
jgi:fatty acid desaturase